MVSPSLNRKEYPKKGRITSQLNQRKGIANRECREQKKNFEIKFQCNQTDKND